VPTLAVYVHDLSPFLIRFTENFGIRWYGLAYVLGFLAAYWLILWFVRLGCCELRKNQVGDFITLAALLGVMVGGRLGYMLFYNFGEFIRQPWIFFQLLDGGMSSHGGFLGLTLFVFLYARHQKLSWLGLGDNLVTAAPVGVFLGRLANFINGELFGRVTDHPWGMVFPQSAGGLPNPQLGNLLTELGQHSVESLVVAARTSETIQARLAEVLPPRHPSQLYEAALEGLLIFIILLAVRLKWKNLYHGILSGLFFILYAAVRIPIEMVREPDAERIASLTRGQFYSIFMVAVGLAFIIWGIARKRRNQPLADA